MIDLEFLGGVARSDDPASGAPFFDAGFDLSGAEGLAALNIGGRDFVYVGSSELDSLASFELMADGTLVPIAILDTSNEGRAVHAAVIGGRPLVAMAGNAGMETYAVGADGVPTRLGTVDEVFSVDFLSGQGVRLLEAHGRGFLVATDLRRNFVHLVGLDETGAPTGILDTVRNTEDGAILPDPRDIAVTQIGPRSFVHVMNAGANPGLTTFEVLRDGTLAVVWTQTDAQIDLTGFIDTLDFGDRRFLVVGSESLAGGLIVYRVTGEGFLDEAFRLSGAQTGRIAGITTHVDDAGRGYVAVQGFQRLTLYEAAFNGSLVEADRVGPGAPLDATGAHSRHAALVQQAGGLRWVVADDSLATFATLDASGDPITANVGGVVSYALRTGPNLVLDPDAPLTLAEGVRLAPGGTLTFQAVGVTNAGDQAAELYGISILASLDPVLTAEADLLAGVRIDRTEPGAAIAPVGGTFAVPFAEMGDAFLHVVVDPLSEVEETDEADNVAAFRVQITPFTAGADAVTLTAPSAFAWLALAGNDTVVGTSGAEVIDGGGGRDALSGRAGADTLRGGGGADTLDGDGGGDRLEGGAGADLLRGGGGADVLLGGRGRDVLLGGARGDVFVLGRGGGTDVIRDFGAGPDRIRVEGFDGGFADLAIRQRGGDTVIRGDRFGAILRDTDAGDLSASDFIFA